MLMNVFVAKTHPVSRWLLAICLGLCFSLASISSACRADTLPAPSSEKRVFAHYMVCFFSSVEFYKREIKLAQRHGIEGFALNCGQWGSRDADGEFVKGNYVMAAERMYQAAQELNSGFQLFFSPDVNGLSDPVLNVGDMVTRFKDHPNQYKHDGQVVLSSWGGAWSYLGPAIEKLEAEGVNVCFVPYPFASKFAMAWSLETAHRFFEEGPQTDGLFNFTADGTVHDMLRTNATARRATLTRGKFYMAGVCPAYNSPNLRDFAGMKGYAAMWEGLIRDGADAVEIVTWNDYNEDSNLNPFRWPGGQELYLFDRDESYLDVTGYFAQWFRTGREPAIKQDKLYVTYRNRSKWQTKAWDWKNQAWIDNSNTRQFPFDQIHDDVSDAIYVTTFLTAPAKLTIKTSATLHTMDMPAGIGHAEVPLAPGTPYFSLSRGGDNLFEVTGRKQIIDQQTKSNSPRGYHLLNRTWTFGVAAGQPQRYEAEAGDLLGHAEPAELPQGRGVLVGEGAGDGVKIPVSGLDTATYNVRITYRNASPEEARLTLTADGLMVGADTPPRFIPAFFPATEGDQPATVSFFWSLHDTTTALQLTSEPHPAPGQPPHHPLTADHGQVVIDAIELIRVQPIEDAAKSDAPALDLVSIPGGTFRMGSKDGQPDEQPVRKVTISPFLVGKYEVTNAEYERFDPQHRAVRDGFSWRDSEPVIYVSWIDAVKYCNWLSEQSGLTPAYAEVEVNDSEAGAEKRWMLDVDTNGFRLPSEAQWEYIASGRGEGWAYPWGNEPPHPGHHGRFDGPSSLSMDPRLTSTARQGVTVVGSYPAGASRDGVMDLAGNVAEWCNDALLPYEPGEATDPVAQAWSRYRAIRGGSWGYYNLSQRSADREYNSQGYPGYVYIGFRIALPEAGRLNLEKDHHP